MLPGGTYLHAFASVAAKRAVIAGPELAGNRLGIGARCLTHSDCPPDDWAGALAGCLIRSTAKAGPQQMPLDRDIEGRFEVACRRNLTHLL